VNLEQVVKISGILTGGIALATLAVTQVQLRHEQEKSEIREWQETAVFSIVSHAPVTGISESAIQDQYNKLARDRFKELPRDEIQTPALERTLMTVVSRGAIQQKSDGNFAFVVGPAVTQDFECRQISGNFIAQLVQQHPGLYTFDDIEQRLHTANECALDEAGFRGLISGMIMMGAIVQGKAGKVAPGPGPYAGPKSPMGSLVQP
jgi:hypothetical protein